ncbi:MAG: MerR family transcriptional regulator [Candidatus Levybacteria bacterium]|nr:MerR family transcriptional regulator [Candidatus Levybacteria bacterium]
MTQGQSQVNLLTIRQFAEVCRTTPRTLRFYEKKGLFKPAVIDTFNGYRFYNPRQAREFLKIKLLQNFHVPLKQIKTNSTETRLLDRLKNLKEEIAEKEKEYKFLEKMKSFLFQDDKIENVFQTKYFGPYDLFTMKVEHGEYSRITEYIKALWKKAERLKLKCGNYEIVFYLNSAYNPKNTPLEIGLICKSIPHLTSGSTKTKENFYFKKYPKAKVLTFEYNGPYEYLILVYQKLFSYLEEEKIALKGPGFDIYKYGPLNTKSKYDYQTTISFPI